MTMLSFPIGAVIERANSGIITLKSTIMMNANDRTPIRASRSLDDKPRRLRSGILGLCLAVLAVGANSLPAADYLVDAKQGNDQTGDGTLAAPWQTVQKAASIMMQGDVCHIRGGIYRETVTPKPGQTFQPYQNEYVLLTGNDVVSSGWDRHTGNILKTAVETKVLEVFVDREYMEKARWPDSDGDPFNKAEWVTTTNAKGGKVVFAQGIPLDFVGGFYTGQNGPNCFNGSHGLITAQNGREITCTDLNLRWKQATKGHIGDGSGYIIHHLNALTSAKEWHWQDGTLYLYPPGGGNVDGRVVEARTRLWAFDCSGKSGVTIKGINFLAASVRMDGADNGTIDGCTFRHVSPWGNHYYNLGAVGGEPSGDYQVGGLIDGTSGIHIDGNGNTVKNCYIANGWGALVTLLGENSTVENCYLESANWLGRIHTSPLVVAGTNQKIFKNTLRKSNGEMIAFMMYNNMPVSAVKIIGNDCRQYGTLMLDNGTAAIYSNGNSDLGGSEIAYNFIAENLTVHKRIASGIYLDDRSNNALIHHNVVDGRDHRGGGDCVAGLFTHRGFNSLRVFNNTFWNSKAGWLSSVWNEKIDPGTRPRDTATMIYRNNHSSGPGLVLNGLQEPGVTADHNREYVPDSELVNAAHHDFRIANAASPSVNAGMVIEGITEGYVGSVPDLGAYEHGKEAWTAGWTLTPPPFPDETGKSGATPVAWVWGRAGKGMAAERQPGLMDNFQDFSKVESKSAGWVLEEFQLTPYAVREQKTTEHLVYSLANMTDFEVEASMHSDGPYLNAFTFSVSSDGTNFTPIAMKVTPSYRWMSWRQLLFQPNEVIPPGSNRLKIEVAKTEQKRGGTPRLLNVKLYNTRPGAAERVAQEHEPNLALVDRFVGFGKLHEKSGGWRNGIVLEAGTASVTRRVDNEQFLVYSCKELDGFQLTAFIHTAYWHPEKIHVLLSTDGKIYGPVATEITSEKPLSGSWKQVAIAPTGKLPTESSFLKILVEGGWGKHWAVGLSEVKIFNRKTVQGSE